jgi:hypothetical protein
MVRWKKDYHEELLGCLRKLVSAVGQVKVNEPIGTQLNSAWLEASRLVARIDQNQASENGKEA